MHTQPNPGESEDFARLDGAILGLLVKRDEQRPWSEAEIVRMVGSKHGNVPDGLARLHQAGLVHRWDELASATYAAAHFFGLTQSGDPHTEDDRRMEQSVLELLLTPSSRSTNPLSEHEIGRLIGVKKKDALALTDALHRLYSTGLVERSGDLIFASVAAAHFDQIIAI